MSVPGCTFVLVILVTSQNVFGRQVVFNGTDGNLFVFDHFLEECKDSKPTHWTINIKNFKKTQIRQTNILDFDADIKSTIDFAFMEIDFEKCASIETPDTCKKVFKFKTQRFCQFMADENAFWSPLTACLTPKPICPIEKGIYRGRNCSFDLTTFNWYSLGRAYWKVTSVITIGRRKLPGICVYCSGYAITKK